MPYLYFVLCILYFVFCVHIWKIFGMIFQQEIMALHNTNWPLLENTWDTTIDMYKGRFFG